MKLKKRIERLEERVETLEMAKEKLLEKLEKLEKFLGYEVFDSDVEQYPGDVIKVERPSISWWRYRITRIKPGGYLYRIKMLFDKLGLEYVPGKKTGPRLVEKRKGRKEKQHGTGTGNTDAPY